MAHNDIGLSRRHITAGIDFSLGNLKTNYVDLYQAHMWDAGTPLEETMRTFSDLVRSGKVRYIGVSNFCGWQLQKALDMSRYMGLEKFVTFQGQYSLLSREAELELISCGKVENVGYLPYSPLAGGWLSGRYKKDQLVAESGSRVAWADGLGVKGIDFGSLANEKTWNILGEVEKIAAEVGKPMSAVALRWVMQRPGVSSTIIGARTFAQLEDNLEAVSFQLSASQMDRLNSVSQLPPAYPYKMLDLDGRSLGRQ